MAKFVNGPPGNGHAGEIDWAALKKEVLARLDLVTEYRALGVEFTTGVPNGRGVLECHAVGRRDDVPSAMVNARTGVYHDSGGAGESLNFWDFALQHAPGFGRHVEVVRHYGAKAGVAVPTPNYHPGGRIREARYDYRDAAGAVRYAVFRYVLPTGKKTFTQHPPDGKGGWRHGPGCMDGVEPLPYRLPELLAADPAEEPAWVVEGEKDADRLATLGLVATTNHQGAQSTDRTWPRFLEYFRGRTCFVLPDNDPGGRAHAGRVAGHLKPVASLVKVVELPGLPPRGDVSDWLDAGGTVEELGRLAHAAPAWEPPAAGAEAPGEPADPDPARDATVADLRPLQCGTSWLWPLWVPDRTLTLLAAEGGIGKTRLCFDLARRIYHGLPWPCGAANEHPAGGRTLWVVADNQWQEMVDIPPAFAIPDEAVLVNAPATDPYGGTSLETEEELADFEARIRRVRPALAIIDTITNTGDFKAQDSSDAKRQYKPLQEIAVRCGVPILCVTHLNAGGKVLGRRAIEKVRVVIQMECPDPEGQWDRRKLWVSKSKAIRPPALGVTMGDGGNEYDATPPEPPGPRRQGGAATGPLPVKTVECMTWLTARLARGAARVAVVRREAEAGGYGASTLYRAKDQIHAEESQDEGGRKWWALPAAVNGAAAHHATGRDAEPF